MKVESNAFCLTDHARIVSEGHTVNKRQNRHTRNRAFTGFQDSEFRGVFGMGLNTPDWEIGRLFLDNRCIHC